MLRPVFVVVLCLLLAACHSSKEELRKELVRQCRMQGANSGITGELKTIYDKLCDCNAEQITANLSSADYKAFEKLKKEGKTAEAEAKLLPVIRPCIEEWQQQSEAAANAQPQDSAALRQ